MALSALPTVGLDIGTSAVKAVVLRQGKGGWSLVSAGEASIGEPGSPVPATDEPTIREAVSSVLDTLRLRRARVAAALPGTAVIVKRLRSRRWARRR